MAKNYAQFVSKQLEREMKPYHVAPVIGGSIENVQPLKKANIRNYPNCLLSLGIVETVSLKKNKSQTS